jgi:hypothetical protein
VFHIGTNFRLRRLECQLNLRAHKFAS